jgi:hypothetical protein
MRTNSSFVLFAVVAGILCLSSVGASAQDDAARGRFNDGIRSRPTTAPMPVNASKHRPARGCFATGAQDASGNPQLVCY